MSDYREWEREHESDATLEDEAERVARYNDITIRRAFYHVKAGRIADGIIAAREKMVQGESSHDC